MSELSKLRKRAEHLFPLRGEALIPGVIVTVQTFGDRIRFHLLLHLLMAESGAGRAGMFDLLPEPDDVRLAGLKGR